MKRRSPLDSLEDLRTRARDEQRAELAQHVHAAKLARERAAEAERARQARAAEHEALRGAEDERLRGAGISAAEGQRRAAWEASSRRRLATLEVDIAQSLAAEREAIDKQQRAAARLNRLDAELKQVSEHIQKQARERARRAENTAQEASDDLALQRFRGRKEP